MTKNGIDVSEWQGVIDWDAVKASGKVDFAVLRAGYGKYVSQRDKQFERNYSECRRLGIPVGAYWYSYAVTEKEAKEEASACLAVIADKKLDYPVYFDLEERAALDTGKSNCSNLAVCFCNAVENGGYWAGLYMSRSPLTSHITAEVRSRYALWVAEYGSKCNYGGSYGMWQRSSEGRIAGIDGNVDLDECYVDYPKLINAKEKAAKRVTLIIDGRTYTGLLEEEASDKSRAAE